jgi:hypothetical protein
MSYEAKGVPARFISVGPTTAAKTLSEGWRLCLRPNKSPHENDKVYYFDINVDIISIILD